VADVYFSGSGTAAPANGAGRVLIGNGTDLQIASIVLKNTTAASALTITGAKGGAVNLGGVTDAGTIGKINGKTVNLSGTINVGGLSSLLLGNVSNSQLQIGSGVNHVAITLGAVSDSTLSSSVPITTLKAASWIVTGTAVQITAPTIGSLVVGGEFDPGISLAGNGTAVTLANAKITGLVNIGQWDITWRAGTITLGSVGSAWNGISVGALLSSLTVKSGDLTADVSAGSIGTLKVISEISGANISTTGDIATLTAGSVSGSTITAGTGGDASFSTTTAANIGGSTIHNIHLTAKTDTFSNSTIVADSILAAALGAVNTDNGGVPEGLIAAKFKSVSVTINGKAVHLGPAQLASDATLAAYLTAKDVSFSDLTIQIL
jgi:hypothetical protein